MKFCRRLGWLGIFAFEAEAAISTSPVTAVRTTPISNPKS
jgi:hypothetical protein